MSKAIEPIDQRTIQFYEDEVIAVVAEDGTVFVPVRPLCELIGVDWAGQYQRIKRDEILNDVSMSVGVTPTDIDATSKRPKSSDMIALPLDYLNGWLFGISPKRVKPEVKPALLKYQRECYRVLYEAFSTGVAVRPDSDIMQSTDEAAVSFRTLTQMARLAREHYYLTKKVDDHEKRIGVLEAQANNPDAYVSQEQAQLISGAVKAIATVLGKVSGRNEFGAVYGELYSRYGVTSYKMLPTGRYEDVMGWLRSWFGELTDGSDAPF